MPDLTLAAATAPSTVAEAVETHARLTALSDWTSQRKQAVAGWLRERAEQRIVEDGAAPTWRTPAGVALLTDPQPKAKIGDPDAFARWFVREVLGDDPDADPLTRRVDHHDGQVIRHMRASVDEDALLDFADRYADVADDVAAARMADELMRHVEVIQQWSVHAPLLDNLIGDRIVVDVETLAAIDMVTGEIVPGVVVTPPGARVVQIRPAPDVKRRVATELSDLIGPPALDGTVSITGTARFAPGGTTHA